MKTVIKYSLNNCLKYNKILNFDYFDIKLSIIEIKDGNGNVKKVMLNDYEYKCIIGF